MTDADRSALRDLLATALEPVVRQIDELITDQRATRRAAEHSADATTELVTKIDQLHERLADVDARLGTLERAHRARTNGACHPEGTPTP